MCCSRFCPTSRGTRRTRSRAMSKSASRFPWTLPATCRKQNSFLPDRASTLRIGRWQRHGAGNSLRRRWTDKQPPVSGCCAFSFGRRTRGVPGRNNFRQSVSGHGFTIRCFSLPLRGSLAAILVFIFQTICRNMPSRNSASPVCKWSRRTKRRTAPSKESEEFSLDNRWRGAR